MHRPVLHAAVAALASIPLAVADTYTTIDPSQRYGTWEGWGVSLAWWAKAFGDRDDLADIFFTTKTQKYQGQDLPGLGFNIARYNAGATSYRRIGGTNMSVSPNIGASRQVDGYWLGPGSSDPASVFWDWSVDANQRLMLQKAKANGADTFELFSNSPMWWMCINDNPSGNDNASADNLRPGDYDLHATYLANIDQHARQKWDIAFQSVEPFNEPSSAFWGSTGTQEGCHFDVSTMDQVVAFLKTEMSKRGSEAFIAASDENTYDAAVNTWQTMLQPTKDAISRINVHGYQGHDGRRDRLYALAQASSKRLWNSEYGDGEATGTQMAQNLLLDFSWLHPTAWVYWQAIDGGGWGLVQGNNDNKMLGAVNTKYFVLAHFTRHIRPGMTILSGGNSDTVAAYDAANKVLVIVAANWGDAGYGNFDLSLFMQAGQKGDLVKRWRTSFDGSTLYEEKEDTYVQDGARVWSWFDPASVQTFEVSGVDMNL
ncbi:Endo-beta-1 6-galactanase [Claviceps lovelessii]|nr:Endo-beta-1 6-galactanase [Claviceps lovelessii]